MTLKRTLTAALAAACVALSVPNAVAVRKVPVTVDGVPLPTESHLEAGVTSVPQRSTGISESST